MCTKSNLHKCIRALVPKVNHTFVIPINAFFMVIPNMVMKLKIFDIFYNFCKFVDMSSALACCGKHHVAISLPCANLSFLQNSWISMPISQLTKPIQGMFVLFLFECISYGDSKYSHDNILEYVTNSNKTWNKCYFT